WEFNIRGIYKGTKAVADQSTMLFHYEYLDESRSENEKGEVGIYLLQLEDPTQASVVSARVDELYKNSAYATLTETERAFNLEFVSMMGNVSFLLRSIGAAVVFTILMVAANTMMMAARERTSEVGILKTLGFPDRSIFLVMTVEAVVIAVLGGLI